MNEIYWYNCIGKSKKHKGNLWMIAVVPRAGTWIETVINTEYCNPCRSFPVRERGLKLVIFQVSYPLFQVVPRAGTWIETSMLITRE